MIPSEVRPSRSRERRVMTRGTGGTFVERLPRECRLRWSKASKWPAAKRPL